jgi:hypothetical protein
VPQSLPKGTRIAAEANNKRGRLDVPPRGRLCLVVLLVFTFFGVLVAISPDEVLPIVWTGNGLE